MQDKDKFAAGLLAIFLGAYGVQCFYLGDSKKGLTRLLLGIFIPVCAMVFAIIGIVEGIKILSMSDIEFEKYCYEVTKQADEGGAAEGESAKDSAEEKVAPVTEDSSEKINLIREYKDLLDNGAITQDEFDLVKRQILGE